MADNAEPPTTHSDEGNSPPSEDSTNSEEATEAPTALPSLSVQDAPRPASNPTAQDAQDANGDPDPIEDEETDIQDIRQQFLSLLPPPVRPRIAHLKDLHEKRDGLLQQYQVERAALEIKYAQLMGPLYEERRRVVAGEMDGVIAENEGGDAGEEKEGEDVKGIPQFWACAMGNMDVIAELIAEEDVDCLEFLTNITCTDFPDGTGFELAFHFAPNPYFTNTTLTKRYEVPNLLTEDEPILKNVTGTTINWKPSKSLTFKKVQKKQRKKGGRGAGQIRTISKEERQESFFHFFSPPKMPALADVMDEEEAEAVEEAFDHDYDVAQAFRGCVVPKAIMWFTGEAMEENYDEGMDGFIVDDDEDGGDDDGDEDGGAGGGAGAGDAFQFKFDGGAGTPQPGADGENPECKQS